MKIAVIAANGRSGRIFVDRALEAGHTIRAGVLTDGTLHERPDLTIVHCDATNESDVRRLIRGCDVVVSFIGHVRGSAPRVQRDAINTVIRAMRDLGIRRIISLTGTGVRFDGDKVGFVDGLLNTSISLIDPDRVQDGIEHAEALRSSGLDWTIVRVLKLQDFASKPFTLKAHGPTRWVVNRTEVAEAILQIITSGKFVQAAPILSKS